MGEVKEAMKPTTEKAKSIFRFRRGKKKEPSTTERAQSFVDKLAEIETDLNHLITVKQRDLETESGSEAENNAKLRLLESIDFHLQEIVHFAERYSEV
jgi:hypothetical protein